MATSGSQQSAAMATAYVGLLSEWGPQLGPKYYGLKDENVPVQTNAPSEERQAVEPADDPSRNPGAATKPAPRPLVEFDKADQTFTVCGVFKGRLIDSRCAVITALLAAGKGGLTMADLERKSGWDSAVKILRFLRKKDKDWRKAIIMAGRGRTGYRIRYE